MSQGPSMRVPDPDPPEPVPDLPPVGAPPEPELLPPLPPPPPLPVAPPLPVEEPFCSTMVPVIVGLLLCGVSVSLPPATQYAYCVLSCVMVMALLAVV